MNTWATVKNLVAQDKDTLGQFHSSTRQILISACREDISVIAKIILTNKVPTVLECVPNLNKIEILEGIILSPAWRSPQ